MRIERDSPEGRCLRSLWDGLLMMAPEGVTYTKWIVTGIAGMVAVILARLDSITQHVSPTCFKWGTSILVVSLLTGSIACLVSLSLSAGVKARKRLEMEPEQRDADAPVMTPALLSEFKEPFWGILRWTVERSLRKATVDPLYSEKNQISLVCLATVLIFSTVALAAVGLIVLTVGLHAGVPGGCLP